MDIMYIESIEHLTAKDLDGGFWVGWPHPPSPETHLEILRGSYRNWLAIDIVSGKVVGFINAISDGLLTAYIPLLEVLPEYQGLGIGSALARRMLDSLQHLYAIDLLCDQDLQPFYERLGMLPASGMAIRNYSRQSAS